MVKYSIYSMFKRTSALIMLIVFFICVLFGRLFYLQVLNGNSFVERGLSQWLRDLPLTAQRGQIVDRNGVVLASSYTTYDVYVRPSDIKNAQGVASLLSRVLDIDYEEILSKTTNKSYSEIKIAKDIEKTKVEQILAEFETGIFFTTNTERNYTYENMLCQVLGFVGGDNQGKSGLEAYYNSYLSGIDGVSLVEADLKGTTLDDSITYYEAPIDGLNLTLTIDFRIQEAVEKIMAETINNTAAKSVSCIVQNPKTGELLAVCSLPSYNLNDIPNDDIDLLNKLSRATTIVDTFEPGSTFKAIVTAIALEEGVTTKHSYFYCGGYRMINGVKIRCSRRSGHGSQSLEKGLMNSCNCVFMDLIAKIGLEKFYDYLDKLGISSGLGIDFYGETFAVLMDKSAVTAADLARMGFGQTIALSALQMTTSFSAVINGGNLYTPHFIKNIFQTGGNILYTRETTLKNKVFSEETSEIMRNMLFSVVDKGGGRYAKVDGYPLILGKTGTAQKYQNGAIAQGKYIASFIGASPYYDPEFVVYVIVDEPQGAYYGGVVAAPVASKVFARIFEITNQSKQETNANEKTFAMPSFIGKTITEAASLAASLGLQYLVQGDGDYVTNQVVAPDAQVKVGDIVVLIFE